MAGLPKEINMKIIQSLLSLKRGIAPLAAFFVFMSMPLCADDKGNLKQTAELKNSNIAKPASFKKDFKLGNLPQVAGAPVVSKGIKKRALKKAAGTAAAAEYAEVAVNILGPNFKPVKTYVLRDVTDPDNSVTLWDGRDSYGRELPKGEYYAQLSVLYSDGKKENKLFKFTKE